MVAGISISMPCLAIEFENVSDTSGFREVGPTSGSAWGDYNSDGWPDLWVSNHHGKPPTLYLNNQGSGFSEVTNTLDVFANYSGRNWPDYHGGAWGDVDNDGDLDFLVITGGGAGRGTSASHFFENAGAQGFVERGQERGLNYPLGRGRTPQWIDINNDSLLDVVVMNKHRDTAPSTIFIQQKDGKFVDQGGLPAYEPGLLESLWQDVLELFGSPSTGIAANAEFAQLALLPAGDRSLPTLVAYQQPSTLFQIQANQLAPLNESLPAVKGVQDAVIADFDGNGVADWLLVRSRPGVQEVIARDSNNLIANFAGTPEKPKELQIRTTGDLQIHFHRVWMDPTDPRLNEVLPLYLGVTRSELTNLIVELATETASLHKRAPQSLPERGMSADYNPAEGLWTLKNTSGPLNIEVTSSAKIDGWETKGFKSSTGELTDVIVFNSEGGIDANVQELSSSPCQAAAAADFDNDGDTDVYLLCATPASNAPDRLLTNQGDGSFSESPMPNYPGRGSQVATADYNNDGFIDLALTNGAGPLPFAEAGQHTLLRNKGNDNNWLHVTLQGTKSNRDGIGAVVTVRAGDSVQTKVQGQEMHSLTQNHSRLHFGLGTHPSVELLEVRWPSGVTQQLEDVAPNKVLLITEP